MQTQVLYTIFKIADTAAKAEGRFVEINDSDTNNK